ncbi:DUF1488 domain-containing protein [Ancylobacter mangrovi]|uniref:DUF1488 domain-containing protein n=1 Tax=Ancylobacter mangrovi TaxID=2972472 RepID=UPI002163FC73|nr:DUF1488 domain-containing protein [Ancylobacter mangrovi]MCS0502469.1 DUF1488 domain-containing protein [Ancylobacter mangrovi]
MVLHHSAMPADDLPDSREIRFRLRGDKDLITCLVGWDVLDRLGDSEAASRADRLARFEEHRTGIEAAAMRKVDASGAPDGVLRLKAADIIQE